MIGDSMTLRDLSEITVPLPTENAVEVYWMNLTKFHSFDQRSGCRWYDIMVPNSATVTPYTKTLDIAVPLWGESTGAQRIPLTKGQ